MTRVCARVENPAFQAINPELILAGVEFLLADEI
jgi:hypothetical protein